MDNLRAAFAWSRENGDDTLALHLASCLQPLWFGRGRLREGSNYFDSSSTPQPRIIRATCRPGCWQRRCPTWPCSMPGWVACAPRQAWNRRSKPWPSPRGRRPRAVGRALTACAVSRIQRRGSGAVSERAIAITRPGRRVATQSDLNWQAIGAFIAGHRSSVAPPPRKGANLPMRSVTRSIRGNVGCGWAGAHDAGRSGGSDSRIRHVIAEAERDADGVSYAIGLTCPGSSLGLLR